MLKEKGAYKAGQAFLVMRSEENAEVEEARASMEELYEEAKEANGLNGRHEKDQDAIEGAAFLARIDLTFAGALPAYEQRCV